MPLDLFVPVLLLLAAPGLRSLAGRGDAWGRGLAIAAPLLAAMLAGWQWNSETSAQPAGSWRLDDGVARAAILAAVTASLFAGLVESRPAAISSVLWSAAALALAALSRQPVLLWGAMQLAVAPLLFYGRHQAASFRDQLRQHAALAWGSALFGAGILVLHLAPPNSRWRAAGVVLLICGLGGMLGWFPFPRAATIGADISLTGILGRRTLPCLTAGVVLLRTVEARPWEHSQASLLSVAALFSLTFSSARLLQENRLARRLALSSLSTLSFLALAVCLRNWQLAFPERNWSAGANLPGGESLFVSILLCELAGLLTALAGIRLLTPSAESDFAETLAGAATQRPGAAALCGLGLLSLAGMPPLPGFWWRLGLLLALGLPHRQSTLTGLIETDNLMTCLTICLGVLLVVSALGRLRLLRQLAFEDPFRLRCEHAGLSLRIAAGLAVLLLLAAGLVPLSLNDAILPAIPKAAP